MSIYTTLSNTENTRLIPYLGGWISIIFMIYSILTMIIVFMIGGPPASIKECFTMISEDRLEGLLRLDILTIFVMPLYYLLFYCLYKVLKPLEHDLVTISTILIFAGVTLFLAAPSTFSYLYLSDGYQNASSEMSRLTFLSAGEAIFSTDIWRGAGPQLGGILVQSGALIISILMLRSNLFTKTTALTGIIMHGFDLAHIITGFFFIETGNILMMIAGPLYPIWFLLIGLGFFKLRKKHA